MIESNNVKYNYTIEDVIPGLWFGLINNVCDNVKGTMVSQLECKPCLMFCTYNEMIPHCVSYGLPLTLSTIISLLLTTLLFVPSYKPFMKLTKCLYYKALCSIIKKKMTTNEKNVYKIMENRAKIVYKLKDKREKINNEQYEMANRKTIETNIFIDATAPEYVTINEVKSSKTNKKIDLEQDKNKGNERENIKC